MYSIYSMQSKRVVKPELKYSNAQKKGSNLNDKTKA